MSTDTLIRSTTLRAVALQLFLGRESYEQRVLDENSDRLVFSPLAGQIVRITELKQALAGPRQGAGNTHVVLTMLADGHDVRAHCEVTHIGTTIVLIKSTIYIDDTQMSGRNVSVRNGELDPWAMPEGYDIKSAIDLVDAQLAA